MNYYPNGMENDDDIYRSPFKQGDGGKITPVRSNGLEEYDAGLNYYDAEDYEEGK